jgi:outer membrane protein OmpA-like peptidoglycan-associated protein
MRPWIVLLAIGCAKQTTPVEISAGGSVGSLPSALPAASCAPAPIPATSLQVDAYDKLVLPSPIMFRTASDEILPDSFPTLQRVVDFMHVRTDVPLLRVEAHSDAMGVASYNMALTQKRAASIGKWLTDHGADCTRLEAVGYGQTRPIAPNTTEEGRRQNRRIELVVVHTGPQTVTLC